MAGDLHDFQAAIASDAVVLVHHRRARRERGEFAQDRLGIALRPTAPAFLAGARSEQLLLGHERKRAVRQDESADVGCDGEPERRCRFRRTTASRPSRPTVRPWRRSMSSRHLAAAGRVRGDECAASRIAARKAASFSSGCDLAALGAQFRRRSGREVLERQGCADRLHLDGRQRRRAGWRAMAASASSGRHEGFGRRQQRPFAVMAPFLVARLDLGAEAARATRSRSTRSTITLPGGR